MKKRVLWGLEEIILESSNGNSMLQPSAVLAILDSRAYIENSSGIRVDETLDGCGQ